MDFCKGFILEVGLVYPSQVDLDDRKGLTLCRS